MFTGSKILNADSNSSVLFSDAEFVRLFGRSFNRNVDVVLAMSGDGENIPVHVEGCTYLGNSKSVYVTFDRMWGVAIRINYLVVLAG